MKDPPNGLARFVDGPQTTVVFNTISVPLGEDPKAKGQAVRVLPVIVLYGNSTEAGDGVHGGLGPQGRDPVGQAGL